MATTTDSQAVVTEQLPEKEVTTNKEYRHSHIRKEDRTADTILIAVVHTAHVQGNKRVRVRYRWNTDTAGGDRVCLADTRRGDYNASRGQHHQPKRD